MAEPSVIRAESARLAGLDWIRGAAAMWVLLYHVDITLQKAKYFSLLPLSPFTSVGYRGVELFFLLSGFVMARTYEGDTGKSLGSAASFAVRRLLRIFPAYFVVFLPLFAVAAWKGIGAPTSMPIDGRLFLSNLLLLPRDDLTTYIPVSAWTLTHELMFYALFLVAFVSWRMFFALLAAWASVGITLNLASVELAGWRMATSPLNAYFVLGAVCYHLTPQRAAALHALALPAGLALLACAIWMEHGVPSPNSAGRVVAVTYVTAFFLMVLALGHRQTRMPGWLQGPANYLGKISYGLYLINYPVIVVLAMALKARQLDEHATVLLLGGAALVSIALADVLHRLVERPSISLGKRLFRRPV